MTKFIVVCVVVAFLGLLSCRGQDYHSRWPLEIQVLDQHGEPVDQARVEYGSRQLGVTDRQGLFSGKIFFREGDVQNLRILKKSDRFFIAPMFKHIIR